MSIAEEVTKVERENSTLKVKLAKAEGSIEAYKQELTQERKKASGLQRRVDEHTKNPLQDQVRTLMAQLKEASVNMRVKKLKDKVQKLEEQIATEQSKRMKSEHHPDVKRENEELHVGIKEWADRAAVNHRLRVEADEKKSEAESTSADALRLAQLYERELDRLGVDHIQLVKSAGLKL